MKKLLKAIYRRLKPRPGVESFQAALKALGPGDNVIDCGANVGDFTVQLAATGATVYAFEPDPVAFKVLAERTRGMANVHLSTSAVSSKEGTAKLYFHEKRAADALLASTGSSLVESKTNVNPDDFEEVQLVRLADVVASLGSVKLMKMDIEGHEIDVLNDLLDSGEARRIERSFVELHDRKNPHLGAATDELRERIRRSGMNFDLSWH